MLAEAEYSELSSHGQLIIRKFQKSDSDSRTKEMFYMLICNQVTLNVTQNTNPNPTTYLTFWSPLLQVTT